MITEKKPLLQFRENVAKRDPDIESLSNLVLDSDDVLKDALLNQ